MVDDGTRPGTPDPPELELAKHVIEYTSLLRHDPGRFARDYRDTRNRFWALLRERLELRSFGSDFFDDLLTVVAHREVARDTPPEVRPVLHRARQLRALRRLQGGDVAGGLAAVRELCSLEIDDPVESSPALDPGATVEPSAGPVLTPALLERLAKLHEVQEQAVAAAIRALQPILVEDQTDTTGPRIDIVFYCNSMDARHHPGYGIVAVLELEADALDRTDQSLLRVGGVRIPVNAPFTDGIWEAIRGASAASRARGGPDLLRGIDLKFRIRGIPGHPSGESAGLAFALLALWVGGCTWQRAQRAPWPGSAAIGVVQADGSVHEVFDGALPAKLRRLRESGASRLYVRGTQQARCDAILREQGAGLESMPSFRRALDVIGVERLDRVPPTVSRARPTGVWLRQLARRHRLPLLGVSSLAFVLVALTMIFEVRLELRAVQVEGNLLTGTYRWGRPRTVQLGTAQLIAAPLFPEPLLLDLDGDRSPEVVFVSMEVTGPNARRGRVRVDVVDQDLEIRWTRFVEPTLAFQSGNEFSNHDLTPEIRLVDDWNGDSRKEIFVVANGLYFPSCTSVWDADGNLRGQFINPGHVNALCLIPGNGSQRDLILLGECAESRGPMLARLPAEFGTTAFPSENPRARLVDHPPPPPGALFVKILPDLARLLEPEAQTWPGSLEYLGPPESRLVVSTLEWPEQMTLLRRFDLQLHPIEVTPSTAFLNDWQRLALERPLPALDSEPVRRAIETVRRWESGEWREERLPVWMSDDATGASPGSESSAPDSTQRRADPPQQ